jgi:molybdenum cofactor biosynthesis enzyme MoaA
MRGWPSEGFDLLIKRELNTLNREPGRSTQLQKVLLAITNRCELSCEHYYERDHLSDTNSLGLDDLKSTIRQIHQNGERHVQLCGGGIR